MVYLIGAFPFYFTTLEEYYTNQINLPLINGPNEGCVLIASFFIFTGIFGIELFILLLLIIYLNKNRVSMVE